MENQIKLIIFALLALLISACDVLDDDDDNKGAKPSSSSMSSMASSSSVPAELGTIVDVAQAAGTFNTLISLLGSAGLDDDLDNESASFTVFAPTDAAFALLSDETLAALGNDVDALTQVLLYHVKSGATVDAATAKSLAGSKVAMESGADVALSLSGDSLYVNLSMVTSADIPASNGVIHVVDAVLMPPVEKGMPDMNIVETAVAAGSFETLAGLLGATGLDDLLADETKTFTVFAPTDAAFAAIDPLLLEALARDTSDQGALYEILTKHVILDLEADALTAYTLNGAFAPTAGGNVSVNIMDGMLKVGGANVVTTDIYANNGVIHVIDAVITEGVTLPAVGTQSIAEIASGDDRFDTLVSLLGQADLVAAMSDTDARWTVFAPTDDAFAKLGNALDGISAEDLLNVLTYHVIDGVVDSTQAVAAAGTTVPMYNMGDAAVSLNENNLYIDVSQVIEADIVANNGIIHVIDNVMMPAADMGTPTLNIVETAQADGSFNTLISVLEGTGLDDLLASDSEQFTVFAPTDAAFDAIDDAVLAELTSDMSSSGTLYEILTTHVVRGASVNATNAYLLNGATATTASGNTISVEILNGMLTVGGATVVTKDIYTTNGIIHVIDAVILEGIDL